jgi:hypothetical protein
MTPPRLAYAEVVETYSALIEPVTEVSGIFGMLRRHADTQGCSLA